MRGKFISIEGLEGAGKSTVLAFLKKYFQKKSLSVQFTREPGGTPLAEMIREVLLHPKVTEPIFPETELLLLFAGRIQHIQHCILPALSRGQWVLSDRFIDASYAYQGGGRGIAMDDIAFLDRWVVQECYPDLTLLLDLDPQEGLVRAGRRSQNHLDRIEQEHLSFFTRVRAAYLQRAAESAQRIRVIDANQPAVVVQEKVEAILEDFLLSGQ